ncbi:MAG TPA: hypothetical protein VF337_03995, partial [Candidatus Limnocylindrales bacterium]
SVCGATNVLGQLGRAPEAPALALVVLIVASAIYYAMLIYAPRQIVEQEGTPLIWLRRYGLFVVSVVLGIAWLGVLGI